MTKEFRRILLVIAAILLFRIGIVNIYRYFQAHGGFDMYYALKVILLDPVNLTASLVTLTFATYYSDRIKLLNRNGLVRIASLGAIILVGSILSTYVASLRIGCPFFTIQWYSLFFVASMFSIIVVLTLYILLYLRRTKHMVSRAIAKSERSQYQYAQLKRQLNPHFLFNSLSILDYLVQEKQTERASDYIKKLANIYRYLLKQEEYVTIELGKEIEFINLYVDILRERFLDGFEMVLAVPDSEMSKHIVPCTLQLLVENAFKHNAVSRTAKLRIEIFTEEGFVVVRNNLNPKNTAPEDSTKYGLKNLKEQYKVVAEEKIIIENDGSRFTVKIPLL